MAETQPGGLYKVGVGDSARFVDANGKETKAEEQEKAATHAVKAAKDADLLALDGIGPAKLAEIRAYKG